MITAIALAVIGLFALFEVPGLSSLSSYWYAFGLGALISFVAGLICCCGCLPIAREGLPASEHKEPQQGNFEASKPSLSQTVNNPTNHNAHPPTQAPKTAEDFFEQARRCVQRKDKDKKNYQQAIVHYKAAIELGHIPSIFYLGNCYLKGKGTTQDQTEAVRLFQEAADKGHVESMYALVLLEMKQNQIDAAVDRLKKIPAKDMPFKNILDTPRTDKNIELLKTAIECTAHTIKVKKNLWRTTGEFL